MDRLFSLLLLVVFVCWSSAQERQPFIINGTPTDQFPAVGIVGEASVGGFCTGTLIGPNHVLTAAHCAEAILEFGTADSGIFQVGGQTYRTASVEIISTYDNQLFTDDVAILVLAEVVTSVESMPISDQAPLVGEVVTLVGFGGQGTPEEGSDGTFGQKNVGTVMVDNVGEFEFSWGFDDPTESNPAPGDSGGPVLIDVGGEMVVAGIVSSGTTADAGLGDINFNMRIDAYADWINETILATLVVSEPPAAEPPAAEPPVAEPPAAEPPAAEPPAAESPAAEPPAAESPAAEPPAAEPPAAEPPAAESPAAEPPAEEPPAQDPPAQEPSVDEEGQTCHGNRPDRPAVHQHGYRGHGGERHGGHRNGGRAGSRRSPHRPRGSYRDASRYIAEKVPQPSRRRVNIRR